MNKAKKLLTLTENQIKYVEKLRASKQITFTEALRRILDEYIDKKENENKQSI